VAALLGPYELRGELGRGAMAVVWRAYDRNLDREVAIKEPVMAEGVDSATKAELSARFVREGCAAARLNHPNIVTIFGADIYDGRPAIVMELIEGRTLTELIRERALPIDRAVDVIDQLLYAIGYAHGKGIVHRDIKPDNVFLATDGRVKLADFGVARIGGTTLTQVGTVIGTPGYMAPEQVQGKTVDARADIFAVGAVAYELACGHNPFGATGHADTTAVMYRIVHESPADPLAKDPAERYQTADEMRHDLRARHVTPPPRQQPTTVSQPAATVISGPAPTVMPQHGAGPAPLPPQPPRRGRAPLVIGVLAALALCICGLIVYSGFTAGSNKVTDRLVTVNGNVVSKASIDARLKKYEARYPEMFRGTDTTALRTGRRAQLVENAIDGLLLKQEAARQGVSVSAAEVDAFIAEYDKILGGKVDSEMVKDALSKDAGFTPDESGEFMTSYLLSLRLGEKITKSTGTSATATSEAQDEAIKQLLADLRKKATIEYAPGQEPTVTPIPFSDLGP
jgi:hypothetical protein